MAADKKTAFLSRCGNLRKAVYKLLFYYTHLLTSIQEVRTIPAFPFLISGVVCLVTILLCRGIMP